MDIDFFFHLQHMMHNPKKIDLLDINFIILNQNVESISLIAFK
jgi:hypothetical protein